MFRYLIKLGLVMCPMLVAAGSFERVVYFVNDYDGSVIHEVSEAGSVLRSVYHAPYGGDYYRVDETPAEQTFGYAGSLVQADGLANMGYRFYDPQVGRFLSPDPVSATQGGIQHFGRFHYANNNPYRYIDPDGRDAVFAVDPDAAGGNGHTTLYFQDGEGSWYSYDQGAAGETSSGEGSMGFLSGQSAPAGVSIGRVDESDVPLNGLRIETSSEQDSKIAASAIESMKAHNSGDVSYNLYSNNCTDAAVDVVNGSGAGVEVSNPAMTVKPNTWIREVMVNPNSVSVN